MAAVSTTVISEQRTRSAVYGLRTETRTQISHNRADFGRRQEETAQTIVKDSAGLELLTKQLNQFKPPSGSDVGNLQEN